MDMFHKFNENPTSVIPQPLQRGLVVVTKFVRTDVLASQIYTNIFYAFCPHSRAHEELPGESSIYVNFGVSYDELLKNKLHFINMSIHISRILQQESHHYLLKKMKLKNLLVLNLSKLAN